MASREGTWKTTLGYLYWKESSNKKRKHCSGEKSLSKFLALTFERITTQNSNAASHIHRDGRILVCDVPTFQQVSTGESVKEVSVNVVSI